MATQEFMSNITIGNNKDFLNFADLFPSIPKGSKTVNTYIQVIKITTDIDSLNFSKKTLKELESIINDLPKDEANLNIEKLEQCLENTLKKQLSVNSLFEIIENLFDLHNTASIDSPEMMEFLSNMTKAKEYLSYISDYITLVFEIQNAKKSEGKNVYTIDQFKDLFSPEIAA